MVITLVNTTASTRTYLSGVISVPGSGTYNVTSVGQQLSLGVDGQLYSDLMTDVMRISDGVTTHGGINAVTYLRLVFDVYRGYQVGGTDSTVIGNNGSRLTVDSQISKFLVGAVPLLSPNYKFIIDTTAQTVPSSSGSPLTMFSYSGSGLFYGLQVALNSSGVSMVISVDGNTLINLDLANLTSFSQLLGGTTVISQNGNFWSYAGNNFDFSPKNPIPYNSSIQVTLQSTTTATHNLNAYFINITQET